jgi:hypothetical protein
MDEGRTTMSRGRTGSIVTIFACALILAGAATAADSGLVAWWSLDDGAGTIAKEPVGNNNGVLMEGPGKGSTDAGMEGHGPNWIAGRLGRALSFDGVNDYVNLAPTGSNLPAVLAALTDCTFTVWANFQHTGGNWQRIWELSDAGANVIFLSPCQASSGPMRFGINADGGGEQLVDAPTTLPGGWHHVAITIDQTGANRSTYTMYLDGVRVGQNTGGTLTPSRPVGTTAFSRCWLGRPRWQNDDYYSGSIDDFRIFDRALSPAEIQSVMLSQAGAASAPNPNDEATDVPRDAVLSWTPGEFAATHDVYIGTVFEDVNTANRTDPRGVLAGPNQDANALDPAGALELDQTYYWRVDEVNGAPDFAILRGGVWRFTVEPRFYPIETITATASVPSAGGTSPQNTVNRSGLDAADLHSNVDAQMWLGNNAAGGPVWIQFEFDKVYKLGEMWVWNYNSTLESFAGFGFKDVTIEYSVDGAAWKPFGSTHQFTRAPGTGGYAHNTTIPLEGIIARYVRINVQSNWGGVMKQYGLSEVRFYYKPVQARQPDPASGAANVPPQVTLQWRAGREAVSHDVYVSTDQQAVTDATVPATTVTQAQCEFAADLARTYCWKVVEVNQTEDPSTWAGDLWSFSTPEYLVVDDFESYTNDSPNRVFQTWIDGSGFSPDEFFPNGDAGNGSGALVGYDPTAGDIMETSIIHGGGQSMPLFYDNSTAPRYSEAERTFDDPQDWTRYGITTLVLFFQGDMNNVGAPVYVKINGTKAMYNSGAACTTAPLWRQWNIDLAPFGATVKSVKTLTIGVGDGSAGGGGTLFIDDIRLYGVPPQVITPTDPGANGLAALYAMEGNVQDSSGKNLHGTANGDPGYVQGLTGYGKALTFDGVNDYVDLPIARLLSTLDGSTYAAWVYFPNTGNPWQRVFDFGTGTTNYMFLTFLNASRLPRFAIRTPIVTEQPVTASAAPAAGWHHAAVVIDSTSMTLRLYLDGALAGSGTTTLLPKDLGVTTQNWLGRSQWPDPYLAGSLDDVRIYNRALSEGEVRYLAGDR